MEATVTAVKEKPILFSGPMVRAILDGRKTQTRRVVAPSNSDFGSAPREFWDHADLSAPYPGTLIDGVNSNNQYLHVPCHYQDAAGYTVSKPVQCERCKVMGWEGSRHRLRCRWESGDRLWVRESWSPAEPGPIEQGMAIAYAQDFAGVEDGVVRKWKPSIHMPRWASRISLEIVSVRVDRLMHISESDAIAEGAQCAGFPSSLTNVGAFARLWDKINGEGAWKSNPWVWVVEFRKV